MIKKLLTITFGLAAVFAFAFMFAPNKASAAGVSRTCTSSYCTTTCNSGCYYPRPYYYPYQYPTSGCACYTNGGYAYPTNTGYYYPTTAGYYPGYQNGYVGWGNQYQYQQPQQPVNNQPGWYPYGGYGYATGYGIYPTAVSTNYSGGYSGAFPGMGVFR